MHRIEIKLKKNNYFYLFLSLVIFSLTSLLFAYFTQYILGYQPCPLCLYQRIPYFFLITISLITIIYKKLSKLGLIDMSSMPRTLYSMSWPCLLYSVRSSINVLCSPVKISVVNDLLFFIYSRARTFALAISSTLT